MTILQQCIVNELEKCEESTPANLVESMFKFIRNETPCVNFTVRLHDLLNTLIFNVITFIFNIIL